MSTLKLNFKLVAAILSAIQIATAKPSGSPICHINPSVIERGHGSAPDSSAGYSLTAERSGSDYQIRIQGSQFQEFKGILMYVTGSSNAHLGSFAQPADGNFKFVSSICSSEGVQGGSSSTITHSSSAGKPLSSAVFTWTPNPGEESQGPFKIQAVISNGRSLYQLVESSIDAPAQNTAPSMDPTPPSPPTDSLPPPPPMDPLPPPPPMDPAPPANPNPEEEMGTVLPPMGGINPSSMDPAILPNMGEMSPDAIMMMTDERNMMAM